MNTVRIILVAVVVFILQVTFVHKVTIAGASPDLMIVLLVAFVLGRGPVVAVIVGFLLGFLLDLGNASFLGLNALAKSIIAYGVSRVGGGFFPESTLFKCFLILAASLVNDIVILAVTMNFSIPEILVSFFRYSILSAVYTAVIGVVVIEIIGIATRRVVRPRGGFRSA